MLATSKIKWLASIVLAVILLIQSLLGGNWGTNYSANAGVNAVPHIDSIVPNFALAGEPDKLVLINGSGLGTIDITRVRITGLGVDQLITPITVLEDGISMVIPDTLLTDPTLYIITVVESITNTIPTLPPTEWDVESNPLPFFVYGASYLLMPLMYNNASH